jgi:hypothetical protein
MLSNVQLPLWVKLMALLLPAIVAVSIAQAPKCESTRADRSACTHAVSTR